MEHGDRLCIPCAHNFPVALAGSSLRACDEVEIHKALLFHYAYDMSATAYDVSGTRNSVELSVVAPVYKCGDCVPELHRQLVAALEPIGSFEIILVNDGCPANSWEAVRTAAAADHRVKGINLSRNFGQHYAIAAGLHHSRGNWVVVMDADLQDRPCEIPNLYRKALDGFDIVYALREERRDRWTKRMISRAFSIVYNLLSDVRIDPRACNFSIASRQVIDDYCRLKELNRSYHLFLRWLGFRTASITVEHSERFSGTSAYSLRRGFLLAIESITSQSNKPLILAIPDGIDLRAAVHDVQHRRGRLDQRDRVGLFHRRAAAGEHGRDWAVPGQSFQ